MVFVVLSVSLSMLFCFVFLGKVFASVKFVFSLKNIEKDIQKEMPTKKNFLIIKKKLIIAKKTVKNCFQTIPFFAKFLYQKEYKNYNFPLKFLINNIIKKLKSNVCLLNEKIDFKLLQNSGIDLAKPVFLIKCSQNAVNMFEKAVEIALKHVDFQPILVCDQEMQSKLKSIIYGDVNLKLLQEINKINLNYDAKFNNKKLNIKFNGKIEKIFDFKYNNVSFFLLPNINQKVRILIKIDKLCYNVLQSKNSFKVNCYDGETFEYFANSKIEKIDKLNIDGTQCLQISLNLAKNVETHLVCDPSFVSKKHLLLKERVEFEKLFSVKIYTKNKEFNSFFNHDLKEFIIEEFKEKNSIEKKKINYNKKMFKDLFGFDENSFNFESYFKLYETILKDVFGIKIIENKFFVKPKIEIDFKVVLSHNNQLRNIYVSSIGKKELVVNGVVFSNISFVDLDLIEKTAFLCV